MRDETWLKKANTFRTRHLLNSTQAELVVKSILDELNVKYYRECYLKTKAGIRLIDFYLYKPYDACLEVDGLYHETVEQDYRDRIRMNQVDEAHGEMAWLRIPNEFVISHRTDAKEFIWESLQSIRDSKRANGWLGLSGKRSEMPARA